MLPSTQTGRKLFEELRSLVRKDYELHHLSIQTHGNFREVANSKLQKYHIPQTGAVCDERSAVQILMRYCYRLPKIDNKISRPLFWHIRQGQDEFQCALLLPSSVPSHLRCHISIKAKSKRSAKGLVALQCIEKLHAHLELNDYLRINSEKYSDSTYTSTEVTSVTDIDGPSIAIRVKYAPDSLQGHRVEQAHGVSLHLYVFDIPDDEPIVPDGKIFMSSLFGAISSSAVALPIKLPDDAKSFRFMLRQIPFNVRLRYLNFIHFTNEDLLHIQRYHRALLCWESADEMIDPIRVEDWTRSSDGVYYLLVPLNGIMNSDRLFTSFYEPREWLKNAADEAQFLVNSLVQQGSNTNISSNILGTYFQKEFASQRLIVSHLPGIFSVPVAENPRKLTDVMMERKGKKITYLEYFLQKGRLTEERLNELLHDKNFELMPVKGVRIKCSAENLFSLPNSSEELSSPSSSDSTQSQITPQEDEEVNHLVPELCTIIGSLRSYCAGVLFPCILWRIQSVFLAQECIRDICKLFNEKEDAHGLLGKRKIEEVRLPHPMLMLEAITPRMALETLNCERLEMLGDSVIKLLISIRLFAAFPNADEGELTQRRASLGKMCE